MSRTPREHSPENQLSKDHRVSLKRQSQNFHRSVIGSLYICCGCKLFVELITVEEGVSLSLSPALGALPSIGIPSPVLIV